MLILAFALIGVSLEASEMPRVCQETTENFPSLDAWLEHQEANLDLRSVKENNQMQIFSLKRKDGTRGKLLVYDKFPDINNEKSAALGAYLENLFRVNSDLAEGFSCYEKDRSILFSFFFKDQTKTFSTSEFIKLPVVARLNAYNELIDQIVFTYRYKMVFYRLSSKNLKVGVEGHAVPRIIGPQCVVRVDNDVSFKSIKGAPLSVKHEAKTKGLMANEKKTLRKAARRRWNSCILAELIARLEGKWQKSSKPEFLKMASRYEDYKSLNSYLLATLENCKKDKLSGEKPQVRLKELIIKNLEAVQSTLQA